ncbi:MAG: hypothetical protein LIO54_09490 [Oscillospiraceae bacterium]|nr:hypothetical protein [Oscillospiraceae bacterium]
MNEYDIQERPETGLATRNAQTEAMVSRQAQEVQAAIVIAKRFPRNYVDSFNRVMEACKRKKLAENAVYEYPRGGTKVTGPSIRLAEALAQNWGNIDFGITELEQKNGESQCMAYAWDLETNTRQTKIFVVKHTRHTKQGDYPLTDPRDIYELVANNGARRLRSCILGVIPGDVVDAALDQCNKTLAGNNATPIIDLVRDMANCFKTEFGVTLEQIEKYIGWKAESFSRNDVVRLKRVYNSLKDGMARKEEIFDMSIKEDVVDALSTAPDAKTDEKPQEKAKPAPAKTTPAAKPTAAAPKQAAKPAKAAKHEQPPVDESFMIPDDFDDAELPWN